MQNIILKMVFILTPILGLISLLIPIYSLIKSKNSNFIRKNTVVLTYIFLTLTLILNLVFYTTFNDISSLRDVGSVLQKLSFILWFVVLGLVLLNINRLKEEINRIKFFSIFTLSLVLAQYLISYFMIDDNSGVVVNNPLYLVAIFSLISVIILYFEYRKSTTTK